jgi:hypothetical protein
MGLRLGRATLVAFLLISSAGAVDDAVNPAGARPHTDAYGDPLPEGAVTRFGTARWRLTTAQGGGYIRLAFSPDGK